jgi:hypothetical protein
MQKQEPQRILGRIIGQELTPAEVEKVSGARWVAVACGTACASNCDASRDFENWWIN